jgi:ADP-heptose:LPS heptosyltransferase|tara:strand:+ start:451 stop:1533 length:1083 start_codon:yes stop_codon:yes gene_type:complete
LKIINLPSKEWDELTLADFGGKRTEKSVCVVRYGGMGDMIQVSSLFPLFKEQGYRVCVNVSERGKEILESDPNVDELLVQETDQVPNDRLTPYWENLSQCFDKFVQLSESIEGSLLLTPQREEEIRGERVMVSASKYYNLSKEEIHEKCNVNYMERTHDLAGLPHKFYPKFYPTDEEERRAKRRRKKVKSKYVILWALSGSSVHKVYPWTDAVMSRILMDRKDVSFVTVGDGLCELLEVGWEKEKRVVAKSGKWSVRDTLAFLDVCDVVVGPETGVLNAASTLKCHKVVLLSHSSHENLSKHWRNTTSLGPEDYPDYCFPCHKMHYGFSTCNRDKETGGAMCAAKINPKNVVEDILRNLK